VSNYTHADLVRIAALWLQRYSSVVVLTEIRSGSEIADAIGWKKDGHSTLIECKASKADFRQDRKKFFRQVHELGIGQSRYFMAPKGLLNAQDLPKKWGLLEVAGNRVYLSRRSQPHGRYNLPAENKLLISCVRRLGQDPPQNMVVKAYRYPTKCTGTIGVVDESDV